MKKRRQKQ